jgi:Fe-S cluster assembly iron-binding protein IscA
MNVLEISALHAGAADILAAYGLHCIGCAFSEYDSLEEGALAHGLTDDDVTSIVEDVNELLRTNPARPQTIALTKEAAESLKKTVESEGKLGWYLRVVSEDGQAFSLEFTEDAPSDDFLFNHEHVPEVKLIASEETLYKIGGATIDYREQRFKLDLPKSIVHSDCCKKEL